jgi:hypothetical protein
LKKIKKVLKKGVDICVVMVYNVVTKEREVFIMANTIKYEIKRMYTDSTIYGTWHDDKEVSVPVTEIDAEKAQKFIDMLVAMGAKHYETSKAHFYETQSDARHCTQYIYYK